MVRKKTTRELLNRFWEAIDGRRLTYMQGGYTGAIRTRAYHAHMISSTAEYTSDSESPRVVETWVYYPWEVEPTLSELKGDNDE